MLSPFAYRLNRARAGVSRLVFARRFARSQPNTAADAADGSVNPIEPACDCTEPVDDARIARDGHLEIQPLDREFLRAGVAEMRLAPHQHAYVSPLDKVLSRCAWKADTVEYVVCLEHRVVGYFQFNFSQRETAHFVHNPNTVGLEAFAIDLHWQGRGLGRRTLRGLPSLVRNRHPGYVRINLTVNLDNLPAIRAYLASGFIDTGERYLGGRSGAQHIFTLPITPDR